MAVRFLILAAVFLVSLASDASAARQMENLTRGIVAIRQGDDGVYVGWRLFGTDPEAVAFNLYRIAGEGQPQRVNDEPLTGATNFVDADADQSQPLQYYVCPVVDGQELAPSRPVPAWDHDYLEIPIQSIDDYRPGDASMADLDGDGELEIVLHQTKNGQDNSFAGITGEPVLDAYKLDGTHLWRINLGKNIREGEHYTQFMVYDLDGDGSAELACKTADGTTDGVGHVIGDAEKDWRTIDEGDRKHGRILDGPEYFTIFDGRTGAELQTVDYIPNRYPIDSWGGVGGNAMNDSFGNRCDRFLACVAYLDGERPSVVMCRGVYGRIVMAAWDWRDGQLTSRWVFDTGSSFPPFEDASPFSGMGGHSLSVADVDDDGRDEIVYQAMVVDDNGEGLYSTGLRHGDSMHITDMYPDRPGMEVFTVQENEENAELYQTPGAAMRDARTGEILWSHSIEVDVGAGMAADIDPSNRGYEAWGGPGGLRDSAGETMGPAPRETAWCIWWDGDPLRELISTGRGWSARGFGRGRRGRPPANNAPPSNSLSNNVAAGQRPARPEGANQPAAARQQGADQTANRRPRRTPSRVRVRKWNWEEKFEETIFVADGSAAGRGPNIMGDFLGDWREEMLLTAPGGEALRLYTTTIPTELRLPTLLHDPQYRLGIVWQNVVYNKPCHPSFFLGDGMASPPRPNIRVVGVGESIAATPE
jgi:rhamnogalacturonan endolyase